MNDSPGPKNIFDTSHIADLPETMRSKLQRPAISYERLVVTLLEGAETNELSLSEIWVALYRQYGVERTYSAIANALQRLIARKVIRKTRRGYALPR